MESFQELGLPPFLSHSLKQMNFIKPTPVQAQAIPAALEGKDVIASAQTGTGKTGAFGIPLLTFLSKHPDQTALIMTPTRELAMQVLEVLRKLMGMNSNWGSVLLIGGAGMGGQLSSLSRKPRLIIGTPGRIIDHLNRGTLTLGKTGFLVLDEADRMLDMGFAPQLEEIRKRLPAKRQTLLFSATIPSNIQAMAARYLKDPVRISVGDVSQPVLKIAQMIIHITEAKKPEELVGELNERQGSVLLFARTQNRVDRITERLKESGFKVTRIHGGRSQSQRKQAIDQFRQGSYRILVATDIAARGLDIHHIAHVINYDLPRNPEDYIHRVGRTARFGAEGNSLCLLTPEDRDLWNRILKTMDAPKETIKVKPSRFGDFTPKHEAAPHAGHRPSHPSHPSHPARKPGQPWKGSSDRKPGNFRPGPRGTGQGRDFRPGPGGHRPEHRSEGHRSDARGPESFVKKERHPDGRHQKRSEGFLKKLFFGKKDSQGNNFIYHSPEEKQPAQNDRGEHRDWNRKPSGFQKPSGSKFSGGRPQGPGRPFNRESRPPFRSEGGPSGGHRPAFRTDRPSGEHRPRPFGDKPRGPSGDRPSHGRPEHRPGSGAPRPHRPGGGGFKRSGPRPDHR